MLGLGPKLDVLGEIQRLLPRDNLAIRIMRVLRTERGPTDKALKHDGAQRPPIAFVGVPLAAKDLRRDVVWSSDRRVCHDAPGFTPGVDLSAVAHCKVDLIEGDGVAVARFVRRAFE